jgi:hypothetical protein
LAERTQFRRDRFVVPIARKHLLPDPLFFRCIFSGRSRRFAEPMLNSGRIVLPKNDRLFNQLVSLERHVARGGHAGREQFPLLLQFFERN